MCKPLCAAQSSHGKRRAKGTFKEETGEVRRCRAERMKQRE
jgi:hypothetical protein